MIIKKQHFHNLMVTLAKCSTTYIVSWKDKCFLNDILNMKLFLLHRTGLYISSEVLQRLSLQGIHFKRHEMTILKCWRSGLAEAGTSVLKQRAFDSKLPQLHCIIEWSMHYLEPFISNKYFATCTNKWEG